jgi:hypothetical protein
MTEKEEEYWCLVEYIRDHKTELDKKYGEGFVSYLREHMDALDYVGSYDGYFSTMNRKRLQNG